MNEKPSVERDSAYYLGQLEDFLERSRDAQGFAQYLSSRHRLLNNDQEPDEDQSNTWVAEVMALRKILKDQREDLVIALEASVARTNERADVLLCGTNEEGACCYDIIEAKGWHTARRDSLPKIANVYSRRRYDIAEYHEEGAKKQLSVNLRRYKHGDNRRLFETTTRVSPDPRNQVWRYREQLNQTLAAMYPDHDCLIDASVLLYNQASVRLDLREVLEYGIEDDVIEAVPIYTRNRSGGSRSFQSLQKHIRTKYADNSAAAYSHFHRALSCGR